MQNRSYLFLLLVLVLGVGAGFLYYFTSYQFGLDVSGGIRLTYQLDLKNLPPTTDKATAITEEVDILDARAKHLVGEGTAQKKGVDQVVVEIPGVAKADEARKIMGSTAKIKFFWAKNLSTEKHPTRSYTDVPSEDPNDPIVSFAANDGSGRKIKPGDAEYLAIIKGWDDPILEGSDLAHADSRPNGDSYLPVMQFAQHGAERLSAWCEKYYNQGEKLAYVLDNKVLSVAPLAPNTRLSDNAEIRGTFTAQYVASLKELLNAGALPIDLKELSYEKVDPTIGKQALGQIETAGAIAFGVVALFLIAYYAFPGVVAALALSLYVLFTLSVLKGIGAPFSLAAIAGFVLSVGMAVDANILVFERFKEEMKRGRTLHSAIELGFRRALPAIVDSNACTILTSLVLAGLGTGPVKGFATTLIIGVLISLFTAVFVTRSLLVFFADSGFATNPAWYAVERNWFKKYELKADTEPLQVVEKAKRWFIVSGATIVVFFFFISGFRLNVEFQGGYEASYAVSSQTLSNSAYAANLDKAGLKGSNVQFATYKPQPLTLTFKEPAKIGGTSADEKVAAIARALGAEGAKPISQEVTPAAAKVTFALGDLGFGSVNDAKAKLATAGLGAYDFAFDPNASQSLIYVTVPPNKQIEDFKTPEGRLDTNAAASFVAEKAGLTGAPNRTFTSIGPVIQAETIKNAVMAVIFSSALIILYLAFRFGFSLGGFVPGLRFGTSAIIALGHDILVVIGSAAFVGSLLGWEISALFITALLTVIGFSVHDTVVIFDRIRENLRRPEKGHDLGFVMDRSITQSFARSLNTSMTVVVTLAILITFGTATPELKFFCVAMLVGIVSGTYSSIYNASPILYLWDKAISKKDPKKGLIGLALEEQAKARLMQTQVRTAAAPQVQSDTTGRSYGQVRRRASADQKKGHVEIDDEP